MTTTNQASGCGVGIIGCGNISEAYLEFAPHFTGFDIRAVSDLSMQAAKERAEQFGVDARTVSELLASNDIDIVINLTVPNAHFEVSKQILEAGKHVYSEKPLVLGLDEALELKKLAEARQLRVGSAPDTFLGGVHQQARALIDEGAIGTIVSGTAHVMSHGMEAWHPNPDFFFQPGGGPILDIGPYYLTNLVQLIGPISQVAAISSIAQPTRTITSEEKAGETITVNTPTNFHALLMFEQGATITLSASWDVWAHKHGNMELYGTDGTLIVPDPNFFGGQLEFADQEGSLAPVPIHEHELGRPNEIHGHGWAANYRSAGLAEMALAIQQDKPHRCSMELAVHVVEAMTAILDSAESGQFKTLSTRCERPEPLDATSAKQLLRQT